MSKGTKWSIYLIIVCVCMYWHNNLFLSSCNIRDKQQNNKEKFNNIRLKYTIIDLISFNDMSL